MSTQQILKCDHCNDSFVKEPVKLLYNGDAIHLCSAECQLKFYATIYHQAMSSDEQIEIWLPEARKA